mmetsp:Transcript_65378/g.76050  ORF Transcript_65378/g.76050 Transcript_65378/m.76050 type:complete len:204 (+) Transcript_65378:71-682(+)
MEQIAQKTKRNATNPVITKTYTIKASKTQQKSKTEESTTANQKLAELKPFVPSKTDTYTQSQPKAKKSHENPNVKAKHSTSPTYPHTNQSKNQKNKNETHYQVTPAKYSNNLQASYRTYSSSTQPSENDSESYKKNFEGFKVVQNGNVILNSLLSDSESESQNGESSSGSEGSTSKAICFATSLCNIGPSSNKISLPAFLMGY